MFEISTCVAKRQTMNPKHKTTPGRSKAIRRKGTFDACMFIHRGTVLNKAPFLEGILDTMKCKFKIETVAKMIIFDSSNLSTNFKKKVVGKWNRDFYSSDENCLRSMNSYYSHNVLGERKYLSLRKANRQSTFENMQIAKFISYKKLSKQINNVDTGELIDISTLSTNSRQQVCGNYRPPSAFISWLTKSS